MSKKIKKLTKISDLLPGKLYVFKEQDTHIFKNMTVGDYTIVGMLNNKEPFLLLEIAEVMSYERCFSCRILTKDNCIGWVAVLLKELEYVNIHI